MTWALAGKTLLRNTTSNHPLCPGINTSPTVGPAVQYSTSSGIVQSGYIGYPGWAAAGLAIKFVGAAVQLLCQKPLHPFLGLPTSREWLQQFGGALYILETFYFPIISQSNSFAPDQHIFLKRGPLNFATKVKEYEILQNKKKNTKRTVRAVIYFDNLQRTGSNTDIDIDKETSKLREE